MNAPYLKKKKQKQTMLLEGLSFCTIIFLLPDVSDKCILEMPSVTFSQAYSGISNISQKYPIL